MERGRGTGKEGKRLRNREGGRTDKEEEGKAG